jgi:hypothetical protein
MVAESALLLACTDKKKAAVSMLALNQYSISYS